MTPFVYPARPHVRRHGPRGYADYGRFLPWLRDEFSFRCVYCLRREQWGRSQGELQIDHFLAVAHRPELKAEYDNLLLVCPICNVQKGSLILPDPCRVLTSDAVKVNEDGTIQTQKREARRLVRTLRLDERPATEFRLLWNSIAILARRFDPGLWRKIMGFPENLPDLRRLKPPGGNSRLEGIDESCLAKQERGELPETY
jgi:5-methylcytosine-specific restriction endonuclease McrA